MATADLVWRSALEPAALIRAKQVSPVEVVDAVLARIDRLNPALNCYATVTAEEARDAAVAAEVAVETGEELGPLVLGALQMYAIWILRKDSRTAGLASSSPTAS